MVSELLAPSAASLSFAFGERALISLFRGAGNLLGSSSGSGPSGMDSLYGRLQTTFQDYFWTGQVLDSYEGNIFNFREIGSSQALAFVNQFEPGVALGAVGYSAGGLSAVRLANGLAPQRFNLLVQIDSYEPLTGTSVEDEILPGTVAKGINYYQVANRFNPFRPGFDPLDLQGARTVKGSENVNVEALFSDRSITHRTIVNDPRVQSQVLLDIERYLLQDLRFDREGQLSLGGGAALRNNILALAPGENGTVGYALIQEALPVDADFSFATRFEFRWPPLGTSELPGLAFWLQPETASKPGRSSVDITFEPFTLQTQSTNRWVISLVTPDCSSTPLIQGQIELGPSTMSPLTAWVNYNGPTDELVIFLGEGLTRPSQPVLSYGLDLPGLVGDSIRFGFKTTVPGGEGRVQVLTWQLDATAAMAPFPASSIVAQKQLPADFTGDGKADTLFSRLAPANPGHTGYGIGQMDGTNIPEKAAIGSSGVGWALVEHNNFNDDDKADLLFRQTDPNGEDEYGTWLMDGITSAAQAAIGTAEEKWQYISSTDMMRAELNFAQANQGLSGTWLMENPATLPQGVIGNDNSTDLPAG